jgi:hypothetical protein
MFEFIGEPVGNGCILKAELEYHFEQFTCFAFFGYIVFLCTFKELPQPIVDHAVDDQVDAVAGTVVGHAVGQVGIDVPAVAHFHGYALVLYPKFDLLVGKDGYVEPRFTVLKGQFMIAVFFDNSPAFEVE